MPRISIKKIQIVYLVVSYIKHMPVGCIEGTASTIDGQN